MPYSSCPPLVMRVSVYNLPYSNDLSNTVVFSNFITIIGFSIYKAYYTFVQKPKSLDVYLLFVRNTYKYMLEMK